MNSLFGRASRTGRKARSTAAGRAMLATMRTELTSLEATDIAEAIVFAASAPPRVNVAELIVVPTAQG